MLSEGGPPESGGLTTISSVSIELLFHSITHRRREIPIALINVRFVLSPATLTRMSPCLAGMKTKVESFFCRLINGKRTESVVVCCPLCAGFESFLTGVSLLSVSHFVTFQVTAQWPSLFSNRTMCVLP